MHSTLGAVIRAGGQRNPCGWRKGFCWRAHMSLPWSQGILGWAAKGCPLPRGPRRKLGWDSKPYGRLEAPAAGAELTLPCGGQPEAPGVSEAVPGSVGWRRHPPAPHPQLREWGGVDPGRTVSRIRGHPCPQSRILTSVLVGRAATTTEGPSRPLPYSTRRQQRSPLK